MNQENPLNNLSNDQIELAKKHCKDVASNDFVSKKIKIKKEVTGRDAFINASNDYYKDTEYIIPYKNGFTIGEYGSLEENFSVFIKRIKDGIKEIIKNEITSKGNTTEHLSSTFKLIDISFDILTENIYNERDKNTKIDVKNLIAMVHGFVNGYVSKLNIKEE